NSTISMRDLPPHLVGAASGVYNTSRQVGAVLGAASLGAVMQIVGRYADFNIAMGSALLFPVIFLALGLIVVSNFYADPRITSTYDPHNYNFAGICPYMPRRQSFRNSPVAYSSVVASSAAASDYAGPVPVVSRVSNPASLRIVTLRSQALVSFDPALSPATTKSVFLDTEPEALPPREIIASFALSREKFSKVPVTTMVRPSRVCSGLSEASIAMVTPAAAHLSTMVQCQSISNQSLKLSAMTSPTPSVSAI